MGTVHNTKGRDIPTGPGQPSQQGQGPDFDELMDDTVARHKGPVCDLYIAGQERSAGNDCIIPQPTIMRHMGMLHEIIIVADNRGTLRLCAAVNLTVLADDIAVTDPEKTSLTPEYEKSCGAWPMTAPIWISLSAPISVQPLRTAWARTRVPRPIRTAPSITT